MKYLFLGLFIGFIYIIYYTYCSTTLEAFTSKNIVLLGDSILKNNSYVSDGNSVEDIIVERNKNALCLAEDHSKIIDIYNQINKISIDFNSPNTLIFLSAGGNDILSYYVDQKQDTTDTSVLKPMFSSYKKVVQSIQNKLPEVKIVLLDIYYPENLQYKQFHSIIKEWNNMVYEFSENPKNKIYKIIRISSHLTKPEDFTFGIEPSSNGGKKIADLILSI